MWSPVGTSECDAQLTFIFRHSIVLSCYPFFYYQRTESFFQVTKCSPFQISLAFSMFRMLLLEWSHKNLGSATLHLFFLICIGFRFATELALKSLRLLSGCFNFSSQPILHLSSQNMYRREHSALLQFCLYVFPHIKLPSQPPNLFHLLLQISGTPSHLSSIPALPAFRRALKHHLFLLAYPYSGAKSGKTKPAQSITFRDTPPATAIAQLGNAMPPI